MVHKLSAVLPVMQSGSLFVALRMIDYPINFMKPPKKYKSNKGKITVSLNAFKVIKKDQVEKMSEDEINELLDGRKRRKKK